MAVIDGREKCDRYISPRPEIYNENAFSWTMTEMLPRFLSRRGRLWPTKPIHQQHRGSATVANSNPSKDVLR
jgi:hypothetical protein